MCFSAEASFTAAVVIGAIGCVTVKRAASTKLMLLAVVPLLFALQQFSEGILWLFMRNGWPPSLWSQVAMHFYTFIAFVFWPVWTPLAFLVAEREPLRKKLMIYSLVFGSVISAVNLIQMVVYSVTAAVAEHSIEYDLHFESHPVLYHLAVFVYLVAVLTPMFLSSLKNARFYGFLSALLFVLAYASYTYAFASVWCFFSAICSIFIYKIIRSNEWT